MGNREKNYLEDSIEVEILERNNSLYHYTTAQAVKSIIESRQLWASKHDFLNDFTEFNHIYLVLLSSIKKDISNKQIAKKFSDLVKEKIKKLVDNNDLRAGYYVISFSTIQDNLTLWSEFSSCMGYNIEFSGNNLIERLKETYPMLWHGKVIYNAGIQLEKIKKLILGLPLRISDLCFEEIMMLPEDDPKLIDFISTVSAACIIYGMFFKNNSFREEKEYRIVLSPLCKYINNTYNEEILFREKDGFLLPYMQVEIKDNRERLPITSITVGPKNKIDLAVRGMKLFMGDKKYNIHIKESSIPLRY